MQTFEQIITKYDRLITAEASKWIQHLWADMEDIKQEVYIIIFKRLDEILQMEDAGGYIRLITKNACRSMEYQEQKQLKDAQISFGDENDFEGSFSSGEIGYVKSNYFEKRKQQNHEYYLKHKEQHKKWYEENKEKLREYSRNYREEHKDEMRAYSKKRYEEKKEYFEEYHKKYYQNHREETIERSKKYYQKNKEKILEQQKAYYKKHAEKRREYAKAYYQKNREKIVEKRRAYQLEKKAAKHD